MRAVLLVVLLSLGYVPRSYAQDLVADAPLIEEATGLKCYTPEQRANIARELVAKDAALASLKADAGIPAPVVVLAVVLGVVLGAGATLGGLAAAGKLK